MYLGISFDDKLILQSQVGKSQVKAFQYFGIAHKPCTPVNLTAARSNCRSCVFSAMCAKECERTFVKTYTFTHVLTG